MSELTTDNAISPLEFFRLKIESVESSVSRANLRRSLAALTEFIGDTDLSFDGFTDTLLGELVVRHLFRGNTPATIYNNIIKRLATLYNKAVDAGLARPTEAFRKVSGKLADSRQPAMSYTDSDEVFRKLQRIIRTDYSSDLPRQLGKDILLYAIYCGGLTFDQIATCRKTDYQGSDPAIAAIVARYSRPKNKYLFPLNQAHSTPRQLSRFIQVLIGDVMASVQLPLPSIPTGTAEYLWTAVALGCGVSASDIAACHSPRRTPSVIATYVRPSAIGPEEIDGIRRNIIATLTDNPLHWYVMQFRPRVNYDMVRERLANRDIRLAETYYPMEEITRKIGGRKVFESRPVISWLLFFRSRVTDLTRLYREIGDLAWGYRQSRSVSGSYAIINPAEIRRYQVAIGDLTEDTELYPEDTIRFQPGDRLIILGGLFSGRAATFDSEKKDTATGRTICRILLDGGHYKDWIIEEDIRLLQKSAGSEYTEPSTPCSAYSTAP